MQLNRRQFIVQTALATAAFVTARAQTTAPRNPIGCQMNAWQIKQGDFDAMLAHAPYLKRLGFASFECNVRFVESQFANAKAARGRIEQTGLQFYAAHMGLRYTLDELMQKADGIVTLGAGHLALSGNGGILTKDKTVNAEALHKKIGIISGLAQHCQQLGLRLVYHNHAEEFSANAAEINEILKQTDPKQVSLLLDVGHAFREQADVPAFITQHGDRIDALHLRDIAKGKQVPLGTGEFDFTALAAAIRKANWPGWLILEEETLNSSDDHYVETVLETSRQVMRKHFGV